MSLKNVVYGRKISPESEEQGVVEQIYYALLEEILSGHWQPGDRLPSSEALSEMSGLSRSSVSRAFERLREEAYVEQQKRKGTFLLSLKPKGASPLGIIGIAVPIIKGSGEWQTSPINHHRIALIQEEARKRGYSTEIKYLREDGDWTHMDSPGEVFEQKIVGIVSLLEVPCRDSRKVEDGKMPLVYMDVFSRDCVPSVRGDAQCAVYEMTKMAVKAGHSKIVCCAAAGLNIEKIKLRLAGWHKAMKEAGLPFDDEDALRSLQFPMNNVSDIHRFLKEHEDITVIITTSIVQPARKVIEVTDSLGIHVPDNLSVIGQGLFPMRESDPEKMLTGIVHDRGRIASYCIDLLLEQMKTGECAVSHIEVRPLLCNGSSLATPRAGHILKSMKEKMDYYSSPL